MAKQKKNSKYILNEYTVIECLNEVEDSEDRYFECVPNLWFVDESKTMCYWPPKCGTRTLMQRAINCEKPDDTWGLCECKVISGGYLTYANGFKIVREKCSQKYNTSSADDQIAALKYRRQHPVLALQERNFEKMFAKKRSKNDTVSEKVLEGNGMQLNEKSPELVAQNVDVGVHTVNSLANIGSKDSMNEIVVSATPEKSVNSRKAQANSSRAAKDKTHQQNQLSLENLAPENSINDSSVLRRSLSQSGSEHSRVASKSSGSRSGRSRSLSKHTRLRTKGSRSSSKSSRSSSRSSRSSSRSSRSRAGNSRYRAGSSRSQAGSSRSEAGSSRSRALSSRSRAGSSHSRTGSSQSRSKRSRFRSKDSRSRAGSSRSSSRSSCSRAESSRSQFIRQRRNSQSKAKPKKRLPTNRSNSSHGGQSSSNWITFNKSRQEKPQTISIGRSEANNLHMSSRTTVNRNQQQVQKKTLESSQLPTGKLNSEINRPNFKNHFTNVARRSHSTSSRQSIYSNTRSCPSRSRSHDSHLRSVVHHTSDPESKVNRLLNLMETCDKRQMEQDRRFNRLEVTMNKMFIMMGDMANGRTSRIQRNEFNTVNTREVNMESEDDMEEFDEPKLPIKHLRELDNIQKDLKDRRYRKFLIMRERDFCTPSKLGTHSITMTKYLKRFVSVDVRCKLTLKEKAPSGYTLMGNYHRVYLFLIDVLRAGYRMCTKYITTDEAHTALRTVWGRSKQMKNQHSARNAKLKRLNENKNNSGRRRRH